MVQSELSTHTKHPLLQGSHVALGWLLIFQKKPGLHYLQSGKVVWQDIQFDIKEEHKRHGVKEFES